MKNTLLAELKSATKDRPVNRYFFAKENGTGERRVRFAIEELRNEGWPIVAVSTSRGYYIAKRTDPEFKHCVKEMRKRAYAALRTASRMEGHADGQMEMRYE